MRGGNVLVGLDIEARLGERVRFKFPAGETELEIIGIAYE